MTVRSSSVKTNAHYIPDRFLFGDRILLCSFGCSYICYVDNVGLELPNTEDLHHHTQFFFF